MTGQPRSLFEVDDESRPLADRLRPHALADVVGQDHLLASDAPIGRMVDGQRLASMVLRGPPGCGKTTIARLLAEQTDLAFEPLSATFSGVTQIGLPHRLTCVAMSPDTPSEFGMTCGGAGRAVIGWRGKSGYTSAERVFVSSEAGSGRLELKPDMRCALMDAPAAGFGLDDAQAVATGATKVAGADFAFETLALVDNFDQQPTVCVRGSQENPALAVDHRVGN